MTTLRTTRTGRTGAWLIGAFALLFAAVSVVPVNSALAQKSKKDKKEEKEDKHSKHSKEPETSSKSSSSKGGGKKLPANAPTQTGTPIMWRDPGNVAAKNLLLGIGSEEGKPKPPFQFKEEDLTGTNPKIKVIDANGVKWNIKFDEEVHAEVACSRIVWACGYMVEESYFVPSGQVNGVTGLGRAKKFVGANGSFTNGMFEKRPDNIARRRITWEWDSNPFAGKREIYGLAMLAFLVNNWDAKPTNNNVLGMYDDDGSVKEWYLVADWGGTLGHAGGFTSHSKWDLADYSKQAFIESSSGNTVKFHYTGKMGSSLKSVPKEHVRWFAGIIGQLTDQQLRDAFRAAGATPSEEQGFAGVIRKRINELKTAGGM